MIIVNDLFDIADRLKEIDSSYLVLFNTNTKKYEVHSTLQGQSSLCFIVPFDKLDARTIDYAKKTRVQNLEKLETEIEENNKKISAGGQ
jgi:hypothetical protein